MVRELPPANQFVAYVDAIGELDGLRCLMDWKTTTSRYTEEPAGLLSLDPQLICYSWITGISEVALVVFVWRHQPGGLNIGRAAPALFGELSCRGDLPLPQSELPVFSLYGNCSCIVRVEGECPQRPTEFAFAEEGRLLVWSQ